VYDDQDGDEASNAFDGDVDTKWRTCANNVGKGVSFNVAAETITKVCFKQKSDNPIPRWDLKYRPDNVGDFVTLFTIELTNGGAGLNCATHTSHSDAEPERCPNVVELLFMKPRLYELDMEVGFTMDRRLQNTIRLDTTTVDWSHGSFALAFRGKLEIPDSHVDDCKAEHSCYCRFFSGYPADDVSNSDDGSLFADGKPWIAGQVPQWRTFQLFDENYENVDNRVSSDEEFWDASEEHTWVFMVDKSKSPRRLRMFKDGVETAYDASTGIATQILGATFNPAVFEIPNAKYSPWGTLNWLAMWRMALSDEHITKMSSNAFHAHMHLSPLQPLWHMVFKIPATATATASSRLNSAAGRRRKPGLAR
jgi:hypothetical protein